MTKKDYISSKEKKILITDISNQVSTLQKRIDKFTDRKKKDCRVFRMKGEDKNER